MKFLLFLVILLSVCLNKSEYFCVSTNQEKPQSTTPSNSIETQCINRINEFLQWYTIFSVANDSVRKVLKLVPSHIKRIDTLGAAQKVNRYYQSGFFTRSWKRRVLEDILAFDKVLSQIKTDDNLHIEFATDYPPHGVLGDPALGLVDHQKMFGSNLYKWVVNGFKIKKGGEYEINLFFDSGWGLVHKWIIQILIENGKPKINSVSQIIRWN